MQIILSILPLFFVVFAYTLRLLLDRRRLIKKPFSTIRFVYDKGGAYKPIPTDIALESWANKMRALFVLTAISSCFLVWYPWYFQKEVLMEYFALIIAVIVLGTEATQIITLYIRMKDSLTRKQKRFLIIKSIFEILLLTIFITILLVYLPITNSRA